VLAAALASSGYHPPATAAGAGGGALFRPVAAPLPAPRQASNRRLVANAVSHLALAGAALAPQRAAVLKELTACPAQHFILALKANASLTFAGLYAADASANGGAGAALRLVGDGPDVLAGGDGGAVEESFRYDSAGKQWRPLQNRGIGPTVDAVTVAPAVIAQARRARDKSAATAAAAPSVALPVAGAEAGAAAIAGADAAPKGSKMSPSSSSSSAGAE
jgi:hypothetical protein